MKEAGSKVARWIAELRRRKVFRVAVVYLVAAWLLIQVADATFEPMGLPAWSLRLVIVLAILGLPIACALAWAFDVTPVGIERTAPLPVTPAGLGEESVVPADSSRPQAPARSVAILPFADLSPGRDQEYFCDGMAEEIINALCCIRDLRIASRTSSFQFKGRSSDVREIGKALNVQAVLEGSVRKAGERVRITAQLVDCADGYHHWSESFDRDLDDMFAIQTEIARQLVRSLQLSLTQQESALLGRGGTNSAEAYDLYLKGQASLRVMHDLALRNAVEYFRRAVEHDPHFAQAQAGLANALAIKGVWRIGMTSEDFAEAFAAVGRALALEPNMPEAFVARGCLMSMQGRSAEAEQAFEEAIRLNPASYEAHYFYARHCFGNGQMEKAVPLLEASVRLRPEEYQPQAFLSDALGTLGRTEDARAASQRTMHLIEQALQRDPSDGHAMQFGAITAAKLGQRERAHELSAGAAAAMPNLFSTSYNLACAYAILGERDVALAHLDEAIAQGRGSLEWIEHDPDLVSLREDPRFAAIVARLRKGS
jgi:TolB-like protein/Flp pilus assembly protein TadD